MTWWVPWMRKCLRHARQSTNGTMRFITFQYFWNHRIVLWLECWFRRFVWCESDARVWLWLYDLCLSCSSLVSAGFFLLPGDSKSIKFLGVFGVDCFFSKSDAFLTKTPQTDKIARFDFWVLLQSRSTAWPLYLTNKNAGNYPQNSRKKPQNSRKNRQTPANPEKS